MFIRPINWWKRVTLLLTAAVITLSTILAGSVVLAPSAEATYTKKATVSAYAECVDRADPGAGVIITLTVVNPNKHTITVSTPNGPLVVPGNETWVTGPFAGVNGQNSGVATVTYGSDWYYDKSYDLPWSVTIDCTPVKPPVVTPPTWDKTKYKLRVTDRCKCRRDSIRVIGKHLDKVRIDRHKNIFIVTIKADAGYKVPLEPGSKVYSSKTTFKYVTTNKPCRCKATQTCKPKPQTCRPSVDARGRSKGC